MPRRYPLIVFDWDGTLFDSAAVIAEGIQQAARDMDLAVPDRETASHVIGLGHSSTSSALMAPTVSYCNNKPLASDDFNGRNALYNCTLNEGGGGGCFSVGASCSSNSQCCSNSCKGKPGAKTCR